MAILIRGNTLADSKDSSGLGTNWLDPSFQNGWVNFGSGNPNVGYLKDSLGFVHIQGVVKNGTNGTTIFTLPVGFRPMNNLIIPCVSNGAFAILQIFSNGSVTCGGSNVYVTMDNISFKAEQ